VPAEAGDEPPLHGAEELAGDARVLGLVRALLHRLLEELEVARDVDLNRRAPRRRQHARVGVERKKNGSS
jgi:hypothetical protein